MPDDIGGMFLYFTYFGEFLQYNCKETLPEFEERYRKKFDAVTKAIVRNQYPDFSKDELAWVIAQSILAMCVEAGIGADKKE